MQGRRKCVFVSGPFGGGKGKLASSLVSYGFQPFSTGEEARTRRAIDSDFAARYGSMLEARIPLPDRVVDEFVDNFIARTPGNFVLDGYPRNLTQAVRIVDLLDGMNVEMTTVLIEGLTYETCWGRVKNNPKDRQGRQDGKDPARWKEGWFDDRNAAKPVDEYLRHNTICVSVDGNLAPEAILEYVLSHFGLYVPVTV